MSLCPFFCYWYKSINEDKSKTLEVPVRQITVILAVRDVFMKALKAFLSLMQSLFSYREWEKFQIFYLAVKTKMLLSLMSLPVPGRNVTCLLDETTTPPAYCQWNKNHFSTVRWNWEFLASLFCYVYLPYKVKKKTKTNKSVIWGINRKLSLNVFSKTSWVVYVK